MSRRENGEHSPQEIKEILSDQPELVRNLGYLACNAGVFDEFEDMLDEGMDFKQLRGAIAHELRDQGVPDPEDIIGLFDIPNEYDVEDPTARGYTEW